MFPRVVVAVTILLALTAAICAEELRQESWRGRDVLRLTGRIQAGTAGRFEAALSRMRAFPHGIPVLLLDSLGGDVNEALGISRLMDSHPIHTVIPDGAKCASACASVVFIAGTYRTVDLFGALGQHSCSSGGIPSQACNKLLAKHAIEHGVSSGSVEAFVTYVAPENIQWFSREDADGWGLTRYPGEEESGFQKSEPRVFKMLTGEFPPAQSSWRIDFREDGFRAFLRPSSDAERELQLNLFCYERLKGRLFLSMEIHGQATDVSKAIVGLSVETDRFVWDDPAPLVWQADESAAELITEVPRDKIVPLLSKADTLRVSVKLTKEYGPIFAQTRLASSREVLKFAANNCASGNYRPSPPLH